MKKISLIASSLVLGTVLFTGCAVKTGNDRIENVTQDNILNMIEDGKSTKADVRKAFGEPRNIGFMDNGLEKWEYHHSRSVQKGVNYVPVVNWFVKGTDNTKKSLVILFDGDIVKTHTFSTENGETMGGLVR